MKQGSIKKYSIINNQQPLTISSLHHKDKPDSMNIVYLYRFIKA